MLKKTVTFEDFDGNTRTEDFYFNLTKAELLELEASEKDGFSESMQMIIASNDGKEIIAGFKKILLLSIGKRDGVSFIKNERIREQFEGSPAFSEIFMELATNAEAGAAFVNGIIPRDLAQQAQGQLPLPTPVEDVPLPPEPDPSTIIETPAEAAHELTDEQLRSMTQEEIIAYFQNKK